MKDKAANKGKQQPDYGDGNEGCSYEEPQSQIQVIEGRRVLRSKVNSTASQKTGNTPVKSGQTSERTEFSGNNARKVGHTRKIAERTEISDVNANEGHGRDPDGVSLDVSDDDYREENSNSDNENFSERDESSHDEGAGSDSGQDQSEVDERPPAQSSSESEDDVSSSSSSSSSEEENDKIRKKFRKDPNYKKVLESLVAEEMCKKKEEKEEGEEREEREMKEEGER